MDTSAYIIKTLLQACLTTVAVTVAAFLVAIVIGSALAFILRLSGGWLKLPIYIYVEAFRNTPVLVQLFIIYFGLGQFGIQLSPFTAASLGLGMNGSAIVFEIVRSSLQAVATGQGEAAAAIGMTKLQSLRYVVAPQAVKLALPSIGNYSIGLVKDTSLASAVALPELAFKARNLVSETFLSTQIYLIVAAIYFLLSFPLARLVNRLEVWSTKGHRKNA